ncbi:MAG: 50S ribosomal protein L11 methyltransferase [Polyangiaceae bacterium]
MTTPRFPFVAIDIDASRADELGYVLVSMGATGVELRDDTTMVKGPGGGLIRLVASFDEREVAEEVLASLQADEPELQGEVGEVVGDEWRDAYKEHFRSFALTEKLLVVPPWEEPAPAPGQLVLRLDPGRAFGTGLHDTTSLVAEQLDQRRAVYAGAPILDVGTGSGILALSALLLGASEAIAIDNDPEVIDVVRSNAALTGLGGRLQVDTTPVENVSGSFPMVVANIRAPVLVAMAPDLAARLAPGGWLVLSGILAREEQEVLDGFLAAGLAHVETVGRGEGPDRWVAIVMRGVA